MATKSTKSLWGIHALGIALWTACLFFGLAYHSSYVVSIPVSILVAGLMFLLVRGMVMKKVSRTHSDNDKLLDFTYKVFYGVIFIASFFFVAHFLHIVMGEQDKIRNNAKHQYEELKNMLSDEHDNSYKRWTDTRLTIYNQKLQGTTTSDKIPLMLEMKEAEFAESLGVVKDLFETSSFSKNRSILENWAWYDLRATDVLNDLHVVKTDCEARLKEASQKIDDAHEAYDPNPQFVNNIRDNLKLQPASWGSVTFIYSIVLALVIQLIILLIIFVTDRGDKSFRGKKIEEVGSL